MRTIVPCDGADQGTVATLLLAMAREKGIDTSEIRVVWEGFEVPDELLAEADRAVLEVPEPEPKLTVDVQDSPSIVEPVVAAPAEAPRRRGRPPGAQNKPKISVQA